MAPETDYALMFYNTSDSEVRSRIPFYITKIQNKTNFSCGNVIHILKGFTKYKDEKPSESLKQTLTQWVETYASAELITSPRDAFQILQHLEGVIECDDETLRRLLRACSAGVESFLPQENTDFNVFCQKSKIAQILRGMGPARPSTEQRPAGPLTVRRPTRPHPPPRSEISENRGGRLVSNQEVQQLCNIMGQVLKTGISDNTLLLTEPEEQKILWELRLSNFEKEKPPDISIHNNNNNNGGGGWGGGWGGGVCCISCGGMVATASVATVVAMMTAAYLYDRSPNYIFESVMKKVGSRMLNGKWPDGSNNAEEPKQNAGDPNKRKGGEENEGPNKGEGGEENEGEENEGEENEGEENEGEENEGPQKRKEGEENEGPRKRKEGEEIPTPTSTANETTASTETTTSTKKKTVWGCFVGRARECVTETPTSHTKKNYWDCFDAPDSECVDEQIQYVDEQIQYGGEQIQEQVQEMYNILRYTGSSIRRYTENHVTGFFLTFMILFGHYMANGTLKPFARQNSVANSRLVNNPGQGFGKK